MLFLNENGDKGGGLHIPQPDSIQIKQLHQNVVRTMVKGRLAGCQRVICGKIVAIQNHSMISSAQPTRGSRRIVMLASTAVAIVLLLVLIGALQYMRSLSAQLVDESDVVYKQCKYVDGFKSTWKKGRHESCGIDEGATQEAREKRERTEAFRREAEQRKHALTPSEEKRIDEYLEQQFVGERISARQTELRNLLNGTAARLGKLLTSNAYRFTDEETQRLDDAQTLVASLTAEYDQPNVGKADIRAVRNQLAPLLTEIQAMLTQKQRTAPADGPRIENLVTRVDDLVARVGTVIRELELAGERVPQAVRSGHRRALQLVREAKQTCSTSRPEGCRQLREVLETIEAMRDPLCAIDSPVINFCH